MGSVQLESLLPPWAGYHYLHCCSPLAAHLADGFAVVVVACTAVAQVLVVGSGFAPLVDQTAVAVVAVVGIAVVGTWGGLYTALYAVGKAPAGCCFCSS